MSVHQRKDGYWFVKFKIHGKWKRKYFGKNGEAEATEFEAYLQQELAKAQAKVPTLAELANSYFEAKQNSLHRLTQKAIVNYLTKACASFLEKPCDKVNKRDLEIMRRNMGNVKSATKNKAQTYLNAIFNWGISQELLIRNPWQGAPKLKEVQHIVTSTIDDFRAIMAHAAPHLKWAFEVSLCLALRPGEVELLQLKWSSFKWQQGCVEIIQGKGAGRKTVYPPESFMQKAKARYEQDKAAGIPWVVHFRGRQIRSLKEPGTVRRNVRAMVTAPFGCMTCAMWRQRRCWPTEPIRRRYNTSWVIAD